MHHYQLGDYGLVGFPPEDTGPQHLHLRTRLLRDGLGDERIPEGYGCSGLFAIPLHDLYLEMLRQRVARFTRRAEEDGLLREETYIEEDWVALYVIDPASDTFLETNLDVSAPLEYRERREKGTAAPAVHVPMERKYGHVRTVLGFDEEELGPDEGGYPERLRVYYVTWHAYLGGRCYRTEIALSWDSLNYLTGVRRGDVSVDGLLRPDDELQDED